ncbi:MAG: tryptophan--tRNA ligase [Candidatus Pacebacteria bacterium]|nr:tryptophan--tRNA ligase [Candidatus Paceibacterota bacterium]
MNESKPVLLSGIKPTGELHLGNYFGAVRQFVEMSKDDTHDVMIMVADYHALNFVQNGEEMRALIHELMLSYMASGLDPEKVVLFKQSAVSAHTELAWIFDTITTVPYLMRAHAYKAAFDKATEEIGPIGGAIGKALRAKMAPEISVGTFNYPMLMAADILLYDTAVVPVGQDQKQHIEYARDTAEKFNRVFGETFRLPAEKIVEDVAIVPGLDGQKMSKSYGNTIKLFATPEETTERVMSIVTDSEGERPENVYALHRLIKSEEELAPLYEEHKGRYKPLKDALAEDLNAYLAPMRARYNELKASPEVVEKALERGNALARERAEKKMEEVRKVVGVT